MKVDLPKKNYFEVERLKEVKKNVKHDLLVWSPPWFIFQKQNSLSLVRLEPGPHIQIYFILLIALFNIWGPLFLEALGGRLPGMGLEPGMLSLTLIEIIYNCTLNQNFNNCGFMLYDWSIISSLLALTCCNCELNLGTFMWTYGPSKPFQTLLVPRIGHKNNTFLHC